MKILVYFEEHASVNEAIKREKQIKRWARSWKIELIREKNPDWRDLFDQICLTAEMLIRCMGPGSRYACPG